MRLKQKPGSLAGFIVQRKRFLLQLVADGPLPKAGTDRQIEQVRFSNEITITCLAVNDDLKMEQLESRGASTFLKMTLQSSTLALEDCEFLPVGWSVWSHRKFGGA